MNIFSPTETLVEPSNFHSVGYLFVEYDPESQARLHNLRGWYYCDGQTTQLSSINALPSGYIWFSNLEWLEYEAFVGSTRPHIKSSRFLPVSLGQISLEIGMPNTNSEGFAKTITSLADNLLRLCQHAYGSDFLAHLLEQPTFAKAIAACLGMDKRPATGIDDELHSNLIWSNLHDLTEIKSLKGLENAPIACMRASIQRHVEHILSFPLPSNDKPWREVTVLEHEMDAFFSNTHIPSLVQVKSLKLPSALEAVYPTSQVGRYNRKELWLPSLEACYLRGLGHIEVGRIFIQPGGYLRSTPWSDRCPKVMGALQNSYSAKLLMHGHLMSAAVPIDKHFWPMHSWWIRGMDRLLLAISLMPLAQIEGFQVLSYGAGYVTFTGTPDAVTEAIRICPKLNLVPTQSAWRASNRKASREVLFDKDWLPETMSQHEQTSYRITSHGFDLTLRIDEASILAMHSEEMAAQAINQVLNQSLSGDQ